MIRSLITATLLTLTSLSTVTAQVNIQDSMALVALYEATNGDNWKNNDNWLSGPVSTWFGVFVQANRVYALNMYDNGLNGYLPDDLVQLTSLASLDLSKSSFSGEIPDVFGQMTDLYQFALDDCGLSGVIPSSLGNCPQLGRIYLSKNQLTGTIPPSIAACTEMIILDLSENNLSGPFPSVIQSLQNLENLSLAKNNFSGPIPEWIASLSNLFYLYLDGNPFHGTLPFLGEKPNLIVLDLSYNTLTGNLEDILGSYPNLEYLTITNTQLSGTLSPDHFNPTKMIILRASSNQIHSLGNFSAWSGQPNFFWMDVSNNNLDFDDLLPNSSMPGNELFYSPQKPIGTDTVVALYIGEEYAIYSPMQDEDIQYRWYFNQMLIEGLENYDLILPPFTPELAGDFYYIASHTALPQLTMYSAITTLVEEPTSTGVVENSSIHVYPNPTQDDVVLLSAPESLPYHIRLYTTEGRLLQSRQIVDHQSSLSLQDYPSGIYLIQSTTVKGNTIKRIVKQ